MKTGYYFSILCINFSLIASIPSVDFDTSMQQELSPHVLSIPLYEKLYSFFKTQYEFYGPHAMEQEGELRIPKLIHVIWLGSPFPEKYKSYLESWMINHPSWRLKLWTDEDVSGFPFINKKLFDTATNFGEKSDIWRYEILERFGGIYVDIDQECLKPLDDFHVMYDFYIGIQPLDTNSCQLGIGIIGARAHHPILQHAIHELPKQTDPRIIVRTGPIFFTKIFHALAGKTGLRDIALPASYFYPCAYQQKGISADEWLKEESYAVHHWAGSWLKPMISE